MGLQYKIRNITILVGLFSLLLSFVLNYVTALKTEDGFLINIFLGIFTGCIVSFITAQIYINDERKKLYLNLCILSSTASNLYSISNEKIAHYLRDKDYANIINTATDLWLELAEIESQIIGYEIKTYSKYISNRHNLMLNNFLIVLQKALVQCAERTTYAKVKSYSDYHEKFNLSIVSENYTDEFIKCVYSFDKYEGLK